MTELSFFQNMQKAMDDQAKDVWAMVEHSRSSGYRLKLGEVSVTEMNFYRLRKFFTRRVYIDTLEPNETKTGADWEWIIGHGDKWLQIRVQAKIINKSGSFAELGHPPKSRRQQMDRLINPIANSLACRWMPLYVFYTAEPPAPVISCTGPRHGCSAQLAYAVRNVYGPSTKGIANLKSRDHLPQAVPWSNIFDGLVARLKKGESLDSIVDGLAHISFPTNPSAINDFWDVSISAGLCKNDLPAYIQAIVEPKDDEFETADISSLVVKAPKVSDTPAATARGTNEHNQRDQKKHVENPREIVIREKSAESDSFPSLPKRTITLDSPTADEEIASLPGFVSVIDIDKLPEAE